MTGPVPQYCVAPTEYFVAPFVITLRPLRSAAVSGSPVVHCFGVAKTAPATKIARSGTPIVRVFLNQLGTSMTEIFFFTGRSLLNIAIADGGDSDDAAHDAA